MDVRLFRETFDGVEKKSFLRDSHTHTQYIEQRACHFSNITTSSQPPENGQMLTFKHVSTLTDTAKS